MQQRGYATTESRFNRILLEMESLSQGVNADPESRIKDLSEKETKLMKRYRG